MLHYTETSLRTSKNTMPLSITTLNNEAASARTFSELKKDSTQSIWINTSDSVSGVEILLTVRQRVTGRAANGTPLMQSTIIVEHTVPATVVVANGNSKPIMEAVKFTGSLVGPKLPSVITATQRKDVVAFARNFLTAANVDLLAQGML